MDQESLRISIQRKIRDGRLPYEGITKIWSSPSAGETCDACETSVSVDQLVMEGTIHISREVLPDLGSREARRLAIRAGLS
jgi:hypothetical protein